MPKHCAVQPLRAPVRLAIWQAGKNIPAPLPNSFTVSFPPPQREVKDAEGGPRIGTRRLFKDYLIFLRNDSQTVCVEMCFCTIEKLVPCTWRSEELAQDLGKRRGITVLKNFSARSDRFR